MSTWRTHPLDRSLGPHRATWDDLNHERFNSHPLLGSEFVDLLLRQFGSGAERLCVLMDGLRAEAMCILVPDRFGTWSSFLPSQTQIAPMLLSDTDLVSGLLPELSWRAPSLNLLCSDSKYSHHSPQYRSHLPQKVQHAVTTSIALSGDFDAYWNTRSQKLRKSSRRYERMLADHTTNVRLECHTSTSAVHEATLRYAALETRGWKGKAGTALGSDHRQQSFYVELLDTFAQQDAAQVLELWIDDRLAASRLVITGPGMLIALKKTYDEQLAQFAPGNLLLKRFIERSFRDANGSTIEFYTNATPEQIVWATHRRSIDHYTYFRNPSVELLYRTAHAIRSGLKHEAPAREEDAIHVTSHACAEELPPSAAELMAANAVHGPQLHPAWYGTLASAVFPDDPGIRFYVLSRKEQCLLVLPIRIRAGAPTQLHAEALGNYYTALYAPAAAEEATAAHAAILFKAIRDDHPRIARFNFTPMDVSARTFGLMQDGLQKAGWAALSYFHFGNWYRAAPPDWPTCFDSLDAALRNTLQRKKKKFLDAGGHLEIIQGGPRLACGIDAFQQVYAASWKRQEPYPEFMPGLMRACEAHGWLRVGIAWLDSQPLAAQVWMVCEGRAEIYKLAHVPSSEHFSCGTLVTGALMAHVIEQDHVREIDFLTGDDSYKKNWMDLRRERWGIVAHRPLSLTGMLSLAATFFGRWIRQTMPPRRPTHMP